MILRLKEQRYFFTLLILFILSEFIVNPIGNFPLNDDWTYGKAALYLLNTGEINIGDFAAMTMWTHVVWALPFMKIFGF